MSIETAPELTSDQYVWRLTKPIDGGPILAAGDPLSGFDPSDYMPEIGKYLIKLGTFFMQAVVKDENEDDLWDDGE
jgi:hypothetical protein